ncbi:Ig-like domain-containing protein [Microbacterium sp. BG28]|uniref:RICIN domain-containing protein n=1 Tax=Microbacterium sp. BG28 TaxID=3097356 RepID=UPI002A5B06C8|nr:Ig-like domain-containing protein [Microbacterium sp. BG28]MDY0830140.1 Ig-like domain-containing protein [Microbacterium sp. BG28]
MATALALISAAAAAPSVAETPSRTVVIDPAAASVAAPAWPTIDPGAIDPTATGPGRASELAASVIATARTGAQALAGNTLPAAANTVRAHFADFIATGTPLLASADDTTLIALAGDTATVVFANTSSSDTALEIDVRSFADHTTAATTVHTTSAAGELVAAPATPVPAAGTITVAAPAHSIVTAVTTGLVVAQAQATTTARVAPASALVGEGQLRLIESSYAPGKVIELGNPGAQPTGPTGATYPAPAAVFTISGVAALTQKQAVVFSPVTARADTYVISTQDGRVLSRRDNAASDFRYLQLTERTIDDAATDPYAQWTAVDAGNGEVSLQNVQRDADGAVAALDLYNWKTADASEVQTYTASGAAVQKWKIHPLTATVASDTVIVQPGAAPQLPTLLRAVYGWGTRFEMTTLTWDRPDEAVWNTDGTVTVTGTGIGYFGEQVPVEARYIVGSLSDGADAQYTTFAGVLVKELQMRAPRTVVRGVSGSEATVDAPVTWDWSRVTDADFAAPGTVTVPSSAKSGFAANLVITVTPAAATNILRGAGVHHTVTHVDGSNFQLTDGVRNVSGFSDWRSGGAANRVNPNTITFYLDEPRQVTGAAVFDIAGKQNIGTVTVQYRTLTGGWANLPGTAWPVTNPTADLSLEVTNEPVIATGVRVIITNKSANTWMTLSEIEVSGLTAGDAR